MNRRRSLPRTAATLALGAMLAAGSAASAHAAPVPSITVAGVRAIAISVVVAPASRYAITVANVGDQAATASEDDPSSIVIEGASAGAAVSGAGLQCTPGDDEIDCLFDPAFALHPGDAVVVNVDGVNPDAGGGAIFTVTADFNGSISSVDVCTTAATDETGADAGAASTSGQPNDPRKQRKAQTKTSPALKTRRSVRARTVTVTVAYARGAAGRLTVTAELGGVRDWPDARRTIKTLKVTRRKIAGRYRYSFTVPKGAYTVVARWVGKGHWADETQTTTYRAA